MRNFKVTMDGTLYEVSVEEVTEGAVQAQPVQAQPVKAVAQAPKKVVSGGKEIKASMPGLIKQLKFDEGASVKKGDVIIVLEAMKMDTDVTAECDGVISYRVSKGTNVESDQVLAVIG